MTTTRSVMLFVATVVAFVALSCNARGQEHEAIGDLLVGVFSKADRNAAIRDSSACLARLRAVAPGIADQSVARAVSRLAADHVESLKSADRAGSDAARTPDEVPFGPISPDEAGVAERLALLTRVARVSFHRDLLVRGLADDRRLRSAARELCTYRPGNADVTDLRGEASAFFNVAAEVERLLSGEAGNLTDAGQTWRDIAVPAVLRATFDHVLLTRELTGGGWSSSGGVEAMIATNWEPSREFVAPWLQKQLPSLQAFAPDSGELFRDSRPLATHPLVLQLWLPKLKEMVRSASSEDRQAALSLAKYIFERGVARPNLGTPQEATDVVASIDPGLELPKTFRPAGTPVNRLLVRLAQDKPQPALEKPSTRRSMACCGAAILTLAKEAGVNVDPGGTYTSPPGYQPWEELTQRTSLAIALGMEAIGFPSPGNPQASDDPSVIAQDFRIYDVRWLSSPPGAYLRDAASSRVRAIWERLATPRSHLVQQIPQSCFRRPENLPPDHDELQRASAVSEQAAIERWTFESRTFGPLTEALLLEAIEKRATADLPAAALARNRLGRASPSGLHLALRGDSWARLVNAPIEAGVAIPSTWSVWDYWDVVRGRLLITQPDPADLRLSSLSLELPAWMFDPASPPQGFDVDAVRPMAAANALLGVPGEAAAELHARLRALSDPNDTRILPPENRLPPEHRRMLAATYLELVLTMLAARDESGPSANLTSLSLEELNAIAERAEFSAASSNAWEFRAGLNGLTLLSRWAELTGDPDAARLARETIAKSKKSVAAVRSALARILIDDEVAGPTSALPLAIAAYDLLVWDRITSSGIEPLAFDERRKRSPAWLKDPPLPAIGSDRPREVIAALSTRLSDAESSRLNRFSSGGGRAGQELLAALLHIRNREFQRSRLLTPQPILPDDRAWVGLRQLLGAVRESHVIEGLFNEGPARNELTDGWRSVGWWSARANAGIAGDPPAQQVPLLLITWSDTGRFAEQRHGRLAKNAALEGAIPSVESLSIPIKDTIDSLSKDRVEAVDVDGLTVHALPDLAFQEAIKRLENAATALKMLEDDYHRELEARDAADRHREILEFLKAPLFLDTADYTEQIAAAIAQVRAAEAEVDAATFDSVSAQMESVAKDLFAQSAKFEIERAKALRAVADLEEKAKKLKARAAELDMVVASSEVERKRIAQDKTKILKEITGIELIKAERTRNVVKEEVAMLRQILDPQNGAICVLGNQIQKTLQEQLENDINKAISEIERWRAIERRQALVSGIGRFLGAVVGFVTGGPAGAALLSQAGGALGDLTNDVIDASEGNVPVEQIFVRLAQNAAGIAKGAGLDLSKELDGLLGAEALQSTSAYNELLGKLEPALRSLPRMLDDKSVRRAFAELRVALRGQGFPDIPELGSTIADAALSSIDAGRDPDERALANPDAFRSRVLRALTTLPREKQTSLRQSIGLENSATDKDFGDRLANLALAKLVGEANRIRQKALQDFVKINGGNVDNSWNSPQVRPKLDALLERLYPGDPTAQRQVLDAIKRSLPNKATYQARIQQHLKQWREGLDERLAKMQEELDSADYSGGSQSELAGKRLAALEAAAKVFNERVVPYLRREPPDPAASLLAQLAIEEQKLADAEDGVEIAKLKEDLAGLDQMDAAEALKQAGKLLEKAEKLAEAAELESDAASVRVRIAEIGEKQAELQGEAAEALAKAAEARKGAAKARIQAALARLDECRARLAAAEKRGAEAAWIREAVSRPPLLGRAAESQAGRLAQIMRQHAGELNRGLAASRDLQRLYRAINSVAPPAADKYLDETNDVLGTWSESLRNQANWIRQNEGTLSSDIKMEQHVLDDHKIDLIRGPFGLKLVHAFGVPPEETGVLRPDGSVWRRLDSGVQGETSRVVAILLDGKFTDGSDIAVQGGDFSAESAVHLGDLRLSNGNIASLGFRKLKSSRFKSVTSRQAENPVETLIQLRELSVSEAAPRSQLLQGVPMSGTLVIRISSTRTIQTLNMTVVYSFTSAD